VTLTPGGSTMLSDPDAPPAPIARLREEGTLALDFGRQIRVRRECEVDLDRVGN
jgi:hypothetical protein